MPAMVVYMIIATANTYIYVCIYINVSVAICGSSHKRKQICLVTVQVQPQRTLACPSSFRRRDGDCTGLVLDMPCLHIVKRRSVLFEFGSVPPPEASARMSGDPARNWQETPERNETHRTQVAAKGKHGRVLHTSWKKSRFRCNYACSGTQRLH